MKQLRRNDKNSLLGTKSLFSSILRFLFHKKFFHLIGRERYGESFVMRVTSLPIFFIIRRKGKNWKMDKIENVKISELEKPRFVRPKEVTFVQNGVERRWEMVNIHNAVFGMAFYAIYFMQFILCN